MEIPNFYKGLFKYYSKKNIISDQGKTVKLRDLSAEISEYLIDLNKDKVYREIDGGEKEINKLLSVISDWSDYTSRNERLMTFMGVRITTYCNLIGKDKCIYCDQRFIPETTSLSDHKVFLDNLFSQIKYNNFYFSISGGEPLIWGEDLYGDNGLIKYLNDKGTYINMNSDIHLLNTDNVIKILKSGLNSLRVSFDVSDEYLFDEITTEGAFKRTLFSVLLIMKLKEMFKLENPRMFFNVVGTKVNLNYYEELVDFLIDFLNNNIDEENSEAIKSLMNIHLIPLGGEKNKNLMPSKDDWQKFVYETIPSCQKKWKDFLSKNEIKLFDFESFANPLNVDMYNKNLDDIINAFIDGEFNRHAKRVKCYCAPTQIYVLPNGDAYPCGIHAENDDTFILGNIKEDNISTIINRNIDYLNNLPSSKCKKCPISTIKLNVRIEEKLKAFIENAINERNKELKIS